MVATVALGKRCGEELALWVQRTSQFRDERAIVLIDRRPFEIHIQASRENGLLCLRVTDNGPGLPGPKPTGVPEGVGLANTRARLQQLYGKAHRFELRNGTERGAVAEVRIPFQTPVAPNTESRA